MMRIGWTYNHKPQYNTPLIEVIKGEFDPVPEWPSVTHHKVRNALAISVDPFEHDWRQVIAKYKHKLNGFDRALMEHDFVMSADRSAMIFKMIANLHEAGASPDEIASVVWRSRRCLAFHQTGLVLASEMSKGARVPGCHAIVLAPSWKSATQNAWPPGTLAPSLVC